MSKTLIIFGHGAGDPGACSSLINEADLVRMLHKPLRSMLGTNYEFADPNVNWFKNTSGIAFNKYTRVLEIHANAGVNDLHGNGATTGTEIYTMPGVSSFTAHRIVENIAKLGFRNRGVKQENFRVIREAQRHGCEAMLLEVCFVGDKDDVDLFERNVNNVASAIVLGLDATAVVPPVVPDREQIIKRWGESGQFIANVPEGGVYVRNSPNFDDKAAVMYYNGEYCPARGQYYQECIKTNKYLYIKYKRSNGNFGYVPVRPVKPDGTYGATFGRCF